MLIWGNSIVFALKAIQIEFNVHYQSDVSFNRYIYLCIQSQWVSLSLVWCEPWYRTCTPALIMLLAQVGTCLCKINLFLSVIADTNHLYWCLLQTHETSRNRAGGHFYFTHTSYLFIKSDLSYH